MQSSRPPSEEHQTKQIGDPGAGSVARSLLVQRSLGLFLLAALVPFLWLVVVRVNSLGQAGEVSIDSYYHVEMADRFPEACIARTFPWMTMSLWTDRFYDKELLFHAGLSGLRSLNRTLGLSADPPFHFPSLAFGLGLIATFTLFGIALRVPHMFFFTSALVALSPVFTQRLLMLRPHLLSIVIMLLFCWHLTRARSLWPSIVFGFVTSYAYSNPHLILMPAIVFGVIRFHGEHKLALSIPLATLAGLVAGLTLHPQFPNTFELWKVQSVDVVRQIMFNSAPVGLGSELSRPPLIWFGMNAAYFLFALLNIVALVLLHRRTPVRKLSFDTLFLVALQGMTTVGALLSQRMFEYGWPFALLASGLLLRDLIADGLGRQWRAQLQQRVRLSAHLAVVLVFCFFGIYMVRWVSPNQARELRSFGAWAARFAPPGTVIANLNWSDFPRLFYSAPHCRYLMGVEPMFTYTVAPEKFIKLEAFRAGVAMMSPREMRELTQASFVYFTKQHFYLAKKMINNHYQLAYQGEDGWVFDLGSNN